MPHSETHKLYQAYVINVREFVSSETEVKRIINRALKTNKEHTVKVQTKLYALLFSTFAEANFMKMILTPYGFDQSFVNQIIHQKNNLQEKWLKCLDLAFIKFTASKKNSEIPNKKLELKRIIKNFIIEPSQIRNKIAHGQIKIALNSNGTSLNEDATKRIGDLNLVTIQRLFYINRSLCSIMEDLIESPEKAHNNCYYSKLQDLQKFIDKSSTWTIETKLKTKSMGKVVPAIKMVI